MPLQSDKLRLLRRIPQIRFDEESPGFSRDQVNRVLANLAPLADEIERLQARLAEAEGRAEAAEARLVEARSPADQAAAPSVPAVAHPDFDETLRNTLVSAQRQADLTLREATDEAERLRTEAEFQSNAMLADARDQSAEMTTEAVRYRERLMAEAAEERARRLDEAREEAQGMVDEVKKELVDAHEAERALLIDQIEGLEAKHQLLQDDVARFESHLQGRTEEVRGSLERIAAVLDEPELLRTDETFEPEEIEPLDRGEFAEIAVDVPALDELDTTADIAAQAVDTPTEVVEVEEFDQLAELETEPEPDALDDWPVAGFEADDDSRGILEDDEVDGALTSPGLSSEGIGGIDAPVAQSPESGSVPAVTLSDSDPYLEELRRVTDEDPDGDDAISDFLDDDEKTDRGGSGGWFGRRR